MNRIEGCIGLIGLQLSLEHRIRLALSDKKRGVGSAPVVALLFAVPGLPGAGGLVAMQSNREGG